MFQFSYSILCFNLFWLYLFCYFLLYQLFYHCLCFYITAVLSPGSQWYHVWRCLRLFRVKFPLFLFFWDSYNILDKRRIWSLSFILYFNLVHNLSIVLIWSLIFQWLVNLVSTVIFWMEIANVANEHWLPRREHSSNIEA